MYAICNLSLVPVRREPSDKSEMVSQLLFGEMVEIINKQDNMNISSQILKIINHKMLNMRINIIKQVILNKILHKLKMRMKIIMANNNLF